MRQCSGSRKYQGNEPDEPNPLKNSTGQGTGKFSPMSILPASGKSELERESFV
jgi:hypothetical protein